MKKNNNKNKRYIYDPLYGVIYLEDKFIWNVVPSPELQRLREIRLCNINSLCLTGGANINRYEHAIGTCYLAQECLKSRPPLNPVTENEKKILLLAALLHDVVGPPFGHSIQYYIEPKEKFDHEKAFVYAIAGEKGGAYEYKRTTVEDVFFGMPRRIPTLSREISSEDLEKIGENIAGKGRFGPLVSSTMDLDNIDNVFRLAYHIGIVKSGDVPLKLAKSIWIENSRLVLRKDAIPLVEEWHKVRKKLYSILLLNPEEFSAKCMLNEAVELAKMKEVLPFKWNDVDYEFLEKLWRIPFVRILIKENLFDLNPAFKIQLNKSRITKKLQTIFEKHEIDINPSIANINFKKDRWVITSEGEKYFVEEKNGGFGVYQEHIMGFEVSKIISRLMNGDLYGCIGIFSTTKTGKDEVFTDTNRRMELEYKISKIIRTKFTSALLKSALIAFHPIIDVDKTERQVNIQLEDGQLVKIGSSLSRLLIGVFFKNVDLNIYKIDKNIHNEVMSKIREEIFVQLSDALDDQSLSEVKLYDEIKEYK